MVKHWLILNWWRTAIKANRVLYLLPESLTHIADHPGGCKTLVSIILKFTTEAGKYGIKWEQAGWWRPEPGAAFFLSGTRVDYCDEGRRILQNNGSGTPILYPCWLFVYIFVRFKIICGVALRQHLETLFPNAKQQKYGLVYGRKFSGIELPEIEIINTRQVAQKGKVMISPQLKESHAAGIGCRQTGYSFSRTDRGLQSIPHLYGTCGHIQTVYLPLRCDHLNTSQVYQ